MFGDVMALEVSLLPEPLSTPAVKALVGREVYSEMSTSWCVVSEIDIMQYIWRDILEEMALLERLKTFRASVDAVRRVRFMRVLLGWLIPAAKLIVWYGLL